MKPKKPSAIIAIAFGKRREPREMDDMDDDIEDMMEGDDMRKGGMMKYAQGGGLKMVDKGGQKVPFFAADGKGKMKGGGMAYAKGGMTGRDGCAIKGKTKGRMV